MSRVRSMTLTCGLVAVLALGAVTLTRAQPPGQDPEPSAQQKLRGRIIDLRTEVEVLQLEHDAMRAALLKALQELEEADLSAGSLGEISDRMSQRNADTPQERLQAHQKNARTQRTEFRAAVAKKRQEFERKCRALSEKHLDLEDAERRYRATR
jgi:tryptophan 2,3-dioxygenase